MAIKAADVKKLRDATGAGMMDAKKALTEADGDFDKAVDLLRVAGQAKAAKRSDREAANGLVVGAGNALVQIGSETDFVAKNADFVATADKIAKAVDVAKADSKDAAAQVQLDDGKTVAQTLEDLPANARDYVLALEAMSGTRFSAIGVGPDRDATIVVRDLIGPVEDN